VSSSRDGGVGLAGGRGRIGERERRPGGERGARRGAAHAEAVHAALGLLGPSVRASAVLARPEPAAALQDLHRAALALRRAAARALRVRAEARVAARALAAAEAVARPVVHPLVAVARHVEHAVGPRGERADALRRARRAALKLPTLARGRRAAPRVDARLLPASRDLLPLGLGEQALAGPHAVGVRHVPRERHGRLIGGEEGPVGGDAILAGLGLLARLVLAVGDLVLVYVEGADLDHVAWPLARGACVVAHHRVAARDAHHALGRRLALGPPRGRLRGRGRGLARRRDRGGRRGGRGGRGARGRRGRGLARRLGGAARGQLEGEGEPEGEGERRREGRRAR
jgi:hypothetical protein